MSADFTEQHKVETYKSMITISTEVFKYLILINGGAAAGMVAGIANIVRVIELDSIKTAMTCFVAGLALAGLAIICAWFTQNRLHNENIGAKVSGGHDRFVTATVLLCFGSLAAFCGGAMTAVYGIH